MLNNLESCYVVSKGEALISADTGLLHVADHLGKKAIALLGPTAFGDPSGEWVTSLKSDLPCQPCSKDGRGKPTDHAGSGNATTSTQTRRGEGNMQIITRMAEKTEASYGGKPRCQW